MTDGVDGSASELSFEHVAREPTLSDKVSQMLLETILGRGMRPGDRLPSERELGEQFGVSRTVIREAVRSLTAKGVLEVRSGSGLRVAAVDATAVSETLNLFLHGRPDLDYHLINEVREMIEVQVAGLACQRRTEADLEQLRQLCAQMGEHLGDPEQAIRMDVAYHRAIAQATHNDLFAIMLDSIGGVLLEVRRRTADNEPSNLAKAHDHHERILACIIARDAEGARREMRAHLRQIEQALTDSGYNGHEDAPVRPATRTDD